MDNENLNHLLLNSGGKQFWIKQWGHPDFSPEEGEQTFVDDKISLGFAKNPHRVEVGDIMIVYRIKVSKLMFVGETVSEYHEATEEEGKGNPLLKRWPWNIWTRNLTPTFGTQWNKYSLKPFSLAKEYNGLNPQDQVKLGGLNYGIGHLRISEGFGKFLIKEIMRLAER